MAKRTRSGGSATIQYEDFQPDYAWKEEEGASVLRIHLPDFLKEQLKITYVGSSRNVRVTGEKPLAYKRFDQTFPAPENCEVTKIQGAFRDGTLLITIPKATSTQPHSEEEAKVTKEASLPSKDALAEKPMTSQVSQKPAMEQKAQKAMEDTASFASPQEALKDEKSQKGKAEVPPKVDTMKQKDESRKMPAEPVKEKTSFEQEESIKKTTESLTTESDGGYKKRKESLLTSENAPLETSEKDKEKSAKFAAAGTEEKPKRDFNIAGKVKDVKNGAASAAKNTMKGLRTMEISEERQSMVNMGVAVLAIVALGAFIAYSYRSRETSKD
ncbi:PREDICTED: inactive protein RESTRICTED TEV MOVEMENT 2-like [Populus euphratica]|uniref:Inactive protein RESTRICTED TEV MOVEMENT 2-like n=1 Tax=Populus euphratica TaxID=75702 RepID=A0AAJ6XML5_POPEU|nr:PREDICTED: inactive protein RESTRICTED TEV MOVEMENT 2-like isoform X1 [Populus euphratica]XP_011046458.1 PREDICTED: inactive protein RESTRICTED TEV MOVEMENT 2-like [Populus euphratica]